MQIRYIGVSNETSYGVMEFVHTAKIEGLPKIVSIQNNYSLINRCRFEGELSFDTFFSVLLIESFRDSFVFLTFDAA